MKILMINKTDSLGGAAQVMQNLTNGLRVGGHEVKMLVRRKFTDDKNVAELSDNILEKLSRKIAGRDVPIVLNNFRDAVLADDINFGKSQEILSHPLIKWADVIHCHNLHGNYFRLDNLIELSNKKKVVWTWHDWWPYTGHCATPMDCCRYEFGCGKCPNLKTYQTFWWDNTAKMWNKKRYILEKSKLKIVVPSIEMANKIKGVIMIHNGVNIVKINKNKQELRQELGLPEDASIVMFVVYGWENVDKGWEHIELLKSKFKQVYWLGVGATKTGFSDGVNFIGLVDQLKLQKYMKASDVFLFPSLAESFGMTPVEAMGQGTPVVGFPVGVVSELIKHKGSGYLAKYNNTLDLENGINFVLKNNLKVKVDDYSIKKMVNEYIKVYETS
ncbi:glycosyltransferase [Candidatus Shapirobacteria bacterium]|nr:glycosyltransferase [Candidatus Shapirobacteria bacterium]